MLLTSAGTVAVAAEDEMVELEEVVVTAQFREQNVQDTPLAITAVSAEMLEARSQTNITEITSQAPSVTLKPQSAMYGPAIAAYIRGIGAGDFNPALEPGVGIYVDDVYFATLTGAIMDLLDLERVEVLRGPQGTLAGRNSIGGAVKLYSKKPTAGNSGSFQATYGSRNRVDLRGTANFALGENLFMRISGVNKTQEGYVDRIDYGCAFPDNPFGIPAQRPTTAGCVVGRDSNVNYSAVRGAVRWLANDRTEINLSADYVNDRRNPTGVVLVDYRDAPSMNAAFERSQAIYDNDPTNNARGINFVVPRGSYYNYASFYNPRYDGGALATSTTPTLGQPAPWVESRPTPGQWFEGWGTALDMEFKLSDSLVVKSISAWREYESGFTNDNDLSPLASSIGDGTLPFHSFTQELRLNGGGEKLEWTLGGYFLDQQSTYQSWQDLRYSQPLTFQQDDEVNVDTKAAFGHLAYKATDALTLTAGLRYTDEHKDYTYVRLAHDGSWAAPVTGGAPGVAQGNPAGVAGLNGTRSDYDGDNLDYRVAAQYAFTPDMMAYVQYATGFKGGGISPRPFYADQAVPFDPEKLGTYELGVKTDLLGRRLRVNGAVFFSDYTELQLGLQNCPTPLNPGGTPCGMIANAGDAEIKGFELESVIRPVRGMLIDASYSYTEFEYTKLNNVGGIQPTFVAPFMPKHKASIGVQHEWSLPNGSSLAPRVDWSFQSFIFTNGNNQVTNRIGGYGLVNARLVWRNADGNLDIGLEGTNLGDKYYFNSRADQFTGAGHTDGAPGRPREWALTMKARF
ncbi:MAG: TonB-dependent receptor [Pseudomonadota bacterium]|nr:TonB-dependent receptor [Pseudomonadota bacterium]